MSQEDDFSKFFKQIFGGQPDLFKGEFGSHNKPVCQFQSSWHNHTCREGYTYLAQAGDLFKIGFTCSNVKGRICVVSAQLALPLKFYHAIRSNCARSLERYLHVHFEQDRIQGEFFRLSPAGLAWIKALETFNGGAVAHFDQLPD